MKSTTDLLNLDFVLSQQSLLTPSRFIREFEKRVLSREFCLRHREQLETLHHVGLLIPVFRFKKNTRLLLREARQRKIPATAVGLGRDVSFAINLLGNKETGTLVDPRYETYNRAFAQKNEQKPNWAKS